MKKLASPSRKQRLPLSLVNVSHYHQKHGANPVPRKIPKEHALVELMTGGKGWVEDQGDWRELSPGDLIWNGPGDYSIGRSDPADPYRCLAVYFRMPSMKERFVPRFNFWPDLEAIRALADEAPRLFINDQFDRVALMNYLYGLFVFQLRRHEHAAQSERYPGRIRAVLDLIKTDYARSLPMKELAAKAACSPAHLHELFQNHTGTSPHQWLLQHRLRVGKERLIGSLDPIKEIAHECGFSDAAAFAHAFKAHTGRSPGAFRKHYFHLS